MPQMTANTRDFLIPGDEYIAQTPDFKLVGRDDELTKLSGILMRKSANNVLVVGAGGVGCSSIMRGLQESKNSEDAPLDIVGKRIFWLDTDGLFSSGDPTVINESFQKLMKTLARTKSRDTILMIDDARVFIDAAKAHGCSHFINSLMREVKRGRFQAVLETRDDDLDIVLKSHPDIHESFTMMDVQEPKDDALESIVKDVAKTFEDHHGIQISEKAILTAIELTNKYRVQDMSLSRAQPERTLNLLDRALASYRQAAHTNPPNIEKSKLELEDIEKAIAGEGDPKLVELGESALETRRIELKEEIVTMESQWKDDQRNLRRFAEDQRKGEALLKDLEDQLAAQEAEEAERDKPAEDAEAPDVGAQFRGLAQRAKMGGFGSREVMEIREKIEDTEKLVADNRKAFEALTDQINESLLLSSAEVMSEFSDLSGIPVDKINQDERLKLLNLESTLKQRVFGQDHAMQKMADGVMMARAGLQEPDKPQSAFLFAGPSGVGKTEAAKALTEALMDDERALLRFDMSEYMEKHAVAKLIGAPPGYDGFDVGGILTNAIRRNPRAIVLFDEIEKAHPDVFNVLLQVLDDGRLTDNRGLTAPFRDTNIIMTTNVGQPFFLNTEMSFEEASAATMDELETIYRPEFLNRFNGRENIVCFKRLELPVIELIAKRELEKVNLRIASTGSGLSIHMSGDAVEALCRDKYDPAIGARGIPGFFKSSVYPAVARTALSQEDASGVMRVTYDPDGEGLKVHAPVPEDTPVLVVAHGAAAGQPKNNGV
ncbi:MAG: AAA family ATPase [Verrucomicrobiota bacterium]